MKIFQQENMEHGTNNNNSKRIEARCSKIPRYYSI